MNQLQSQPQQQSLVNQESHLTSFFSNPDFYKLITPELKETLPYASVIGKTKIPNSSSTIVSSDILSFVPLLESNDIKASVFNGSNNKIIASKLANAKIDDVIQRTFINSEDSKALIIKKLFLYQTQNLKKLNIKMENFPILMIKKGMILMLKILRMVSLRKLQTLNQVLIKKI
ncbi:uncharacterized protein ASCRUDRAFT_80477 [Ascoidea rubescens DSM 1968]|uniref:Uncharacterized protein n=1 Tax=Ascoidea rubescens DSM 1968 TaxID=1344418 RepID=A0A1D2VID3_9ASCO|nr:hypothetical protein ASCRUDRAFT_80477 [Ascoidea rubescens DSM 1968]ODV61375.1 hypothetical protein ASCRUDRAFT_80477 [Ascoidea rubescens DSM 1968]